MWVIAGQENRSHLELQNEGSFEQFLFPSVYLSFLFFSGHLSVVRRKPDTGRSGDGYDK